MVKGWEPGDQLGSLVGTVILAATATSGPCSRGPSPGPYFTGEEYEAQRDEPGLEPKSVQNLLLSTYSAGGGGDRKGRSPKSTLSAKIHPFFPVLPVFNIFLQLSLSAPAPQLLLSFPKCGLSMCHVPSTVPRTGEMQGYTGQTTAQSLWGSF